MATKQFLGGVGVVSAFDSAGNLILTANTLLDSGFTLGTTAEDVRGGEGNGLLGRYYHDSTFDVSLTSPLFSLEYIALMSGSTIEQGADMMSNEGGTVTANKVTILGTPLNNEAWVSIKGEETFTKVVVQDKSFDFTAPDGTEVCIRYFASDVDAQHIKISSTMIPSEVRLVITAKTYRAGANVAAGASSQVGVLQVDIPRFQFSGNLELTMSSSGVSQTPLNGSALINFDPSCDATAGYYAIVSTKELGANQLDGVFALAVENANNIEVSMSGTTTYTLKVYGLKSLGAPFVVDNSLLTFTSDKPETFTVGANTGVITAVAAGSGNVNITVTDNSSIQATSSVTVGA